jgi:hypothetical protein
MPNRRITKTHKDGIRYTLCRSVAFLANQIGTKEYFWCPIVGCANLNFGAIRKCVNHLEFI